MTAHLCQFFLLICLKPYKKIERTSKTSQIKETSRFSIYRTFSLRRMWRNDNRTMGKGHGGLYRYYRCTKKNGKCEQGYLRKKSSSLKSENGFNKSASRRLDRVYGEKTDEWEKKKMYRREALSSGLKAMSERHKKARQFDYALS